VGGEPLGKTDRHALPWSKNATRIRRGDTGHCRSSAGVPEATKHRRAGWLRDDLRTPASGALGLLGTMGSA